MVLLIHMEAWLEKWNFKFATITFMSLVCDFAGNIKWVKGGVRLGKLNVVKNKI